MIGSLSHKLVEGAIRLEEPVVCEDLQSGFTAQVDPDLDIVRIVKNLVIDS